MLTAEQKTAIRDYTEKGFRRMNEQLREGTVTLFMQRKIDILEDALDKLADFRGEVYRGATIADRSVIEKYRAVGKEVLEDAFTSATKSPLKAFSGNVRFYLLSKHGKDISPWSAHPDEEEVLFKPGTRFKILEFAESRTDIELFLEEI